jgi:hypothetical protein
MTFGTVTIPQRVMNVSGIKKFPEFFMTIQADRVHSVVKQSRYCADMGVMTFHAFSLLK